MSDFRLDSLNPIYLLKGLLKDKGARDYSPVSITDLRVRIAELDDIEDSLIDEMRKLEELFGEMVDDRILILKFIANETNLHVGVNSTGMRYSIYWRFKEEGNRASDVFDMSDAIAGYVARLPIRHQRMVVDFEHRRMHLNYLMQALQKDRTICAEYLRGYMQAEIAFSKAGCACSIE